MSELRTVATIRKNNVEEIRIRLRVHDGFTQVDVRVFSPPRRSSGEPYPTSAGICIGKKNLPALIEALQAAEREAS